MKNKKELESDEVNPRFNQTAATVVDYLEELCRETDVAGSEKQAETSEKEVNFDGFGTEHASFLLRDKK